ncbi:hypothetical protein CAPTEDRAFT_108783 [Capitella teleta]|uniref:BTB domain-containing protein n=1 Tax=Capitella teleta TaxID=283909 RepID=R7T7T3_CAPTE|nr:hypothetical protein CAPTEDRAFT_108783 [Capitella teleta]|eukprot:ELT89498.1 hypothetical protein CAPTEDRAFT_108783 [Capitella teleta]
MTEDSSASVTFESQSVHREAFSVLLEFYAHQTLCDVEIVVGARSFRCHRLILASVSAYFRAMFTSQMTETLSSSVTIHDIDPAAFELLLLYAYTAKISFSTENVQTLLYASSILQMESVASACGEFMKNHLHPSNCIGVRAFAEQHGRTDLVLKADDFIRDQFRHVVAQEEFLSMTSPHLIKIIESNDLNVRSEQEVYEPIMKWVKHKADRHTHLPALLSRVKLALLPAKYLVEKVCTEEFLKQNLECRDLLDEAKYYQLSLARVLPGMQLTEKILPRKSCAGVIFCVGGRGASGDPFKSIEVYDLRKNSWHQVTEMSSRRRHVGVVSIGEKLCAVGGHDGQDHLNTGEIFDPATNTWSVISPMVSLRRGIGLACLGGPIYAVGGLDDSTCFSTVERYDPESNSWSAVQSMNFPRGGVAIATAKGFLYAMGGNDGATSLDSCERYDPHLNKWTMIASMKQRRAGAGAAEINGKIYMIGGFDNNAPLDSVECYNTETDTWVCVAKMSCPRGGVGVAPLAGRIFAVGGHDGSSYLSSVEAYDPRSDKWSSVASISSNRAGAGISTVMCRFDSLIDISKVNLSPAGTVALHCRHLQATV